MFLIRHVLLSITHNPSYTFIGYSHAWVYALNVTHTPHASTFVLIPTNSYNPSYCFKGYLYATHPNLKFTALNS